MLSGGDDVHEYSAFWSPDGNWIAYSAIEVEGDCHPYDFFYTLSIMRPDGTDKQALVREIAEGRSMDNRGCKSWSPDSKWFVFDKRSEFDKRSGAANQKSIFAVNIETKGQIRLTKDYLDGNAFWSPDNTRILFQEDFEEVSIPEAEGIPSRDNGDYGKDLLLLNLNPAYFPPYSPGEEPPPSQSPSSDGDGEWRTLKSRAQTRTTPITTEMGRHP